jgi:hypothetical protein
MRQSPTPIKEPEHTYETLNAELYHKGNGAVMMKRKVGNHTWLIRDGDTIAVKLHETEVLTYTPDGRVTLNADSWTTVTTKDRMNAFLGWDTVTLYRGTFTVNVRFRVYDPDEYQATWVQATVPFENYMTVDVHTHELVKHPGASFARTDDSLVMREAADLSRILRTRTLMLNSKLQDDTLTRSDISYALQVLHKFQEERERLVSNMSRLESSMDWAATELEDAIGMAARKQGDKWFDRRGKLVHLFDPDETEAILADLPDE